MVAHGTSKEVEKAKDILEVSNAVESSIHYA